MPNDICALCGFCRLRIAMLNISNFLSAAALNTCSLQERELQYWKPVKSISFEIVLIKTSYWGVLSLKWFFDMKI